MKKLFFFIGLVMLAFNGHAQKVHLVTAAALKMPPANPTRGYDTTLESPNYFPGNIVVYMVPNMGYLAGTNNISTECFMKYSLSAYSTILGIPLDTPAYITKVKIQYGVATVGSSPGNVYCKVYKVAYNPLVNYVDSTGTYMGGDAPGDSIGISDPVSMSSFSIPTTTFFEQEFTFPNPIRITDDSFFVSILFSSNPGDTLALASTKVNSPFPTEPASCWLGDRAKHTYESVDFVSGITSTIDAAIFPTVSASIKVPTTCTTYFHLYPDTVPHVWLISYLASGATPFQYTWSWGDGTSSTTSSDTISHTYADSGYYNICLTTTDTTGCVSTHCDSTFIFRTDGSNQMVKIYASKNNNIATGVPSTVNNADYVLYPNPSNGNFVASVSGNETIKRITITNTIGQVISDDYTTSGNNKAIQLHLPDASGLYFVHLKGDRSECVRKVVRE